MSSRLGPLAVAGVLAVAPARPHHSFAAEFDYNKLVKLDAIVTKIDWTNPHVEFYFDVKDDQGRVANWWCEGGPPNALVRKGWSKEMLKPGDAVVVEGWLAKNGSKACSARSIRLPGGRTVAASGASAEGYAGR